MENKVNGNLKDLDEEDAYKYGLKNVWMNASTLWKYDFYNYIFEKYPRRWWSTVTEMRDEWTENTFWKTNT